MIENNVRNVLLALGVPRAQLPMVTPNMYQAPAVSDPKSPHIMIVVGYLQDALNHTGYNLARTGYLDVPTANAMQAVVGPGWERMTWIDNIAAVLSYVKAGPGITRASAALAPAQRADVTLSGVLDAPSFLPDVPGGLVTYAVAGFFLYRHFKKRGRK